jgi:hypothetical protein
MEDYRVGNRRSHYTRSAGDLLLNVNKTENKRKIELCLQHEVVFSSSTLFVNFHFTLVVTLNYSRYETDLGLSAGYQGMWYHTVWVDRYQRFRGTCHLYPPSSKIGEACFSKHWYLSTKSTQHHKAIILILLQNVGVVTIHCELINSFLCVSLNVDHIKKCVKFETYDSF